MVKKIMVSEPAMPTFTFCVVSFIGEVSPKLADMSARARAESPYLRARYGIPEPTNRRYQKWFTPALIALVVGGSWLAWSANHYSRPEIRSTLISFHAVDASHMSVRYSVEFRSKGKAHLCQLIARDFSANTVGEITDHFAAGTSSTTLVSVIPTRVAAVNAAIIRCALA